VFDGKQSDATLHARLCGNDVMVKSTHASLANTGVQPSLATTRRLHSLRSVPFADIPAVNHLSEIYTDRQQLHHIFPHYLINGKVLRKTLLNIKCVFLFSLQILSETFLI
jgi:hypothetical protein